MIVRNESRVINRCLDSLKNYIDSWVIVDTGSCDGTQEMIKKCLSKIPGELYERSWINFEVCRNQALALAKDRADYLLFIDADEMFVPEEGFSWGFLEKDCYFANFLLENGTLIQRIFLAAAKHDWVWKGVLHEELTIQKKLTGSILQGAKIHVSQDGHRSLDPQKYWKDALLLEEELKKRPDDTHALFYLGMSYDMAGEREKSLKAYRKRAMFGGWDQEIYYAHFRCAQLQEKLSFPKADVIANFCKAFQSRPVRAEPLCYLADLFNRMGCPLLASLLARFGLSIPLPSDRAFVERDVYDYKLLISAADAATLLGKRVLAASLLRQVLTQKFLSSETREKILHVLPQLDWYIVLPVETRPKTYS